MMMTPFDESKPSISARSWFKVCSRSSWPPMNPVLPARDLPIASSSSMKMMHGALSLACSNKSRTRAAPTPTNISTNSEPDRVKKGTSASPATARASRVLPVPGGPTSRTPFGIRPPSRWYFFGFFRKSTISTSSALASSTPATSTNVDFLKHPKKYQDRKSTRLNSSHEWISYAVFCLKKKQRSQENITNKKKKQKKTTKRLRNT